MRFICGACGEQVDPTKEHVCGTVEAEKAKDRRDRFAMATLTGLLAQDGASGRPDAHATWAVAYADALIAELDKTKP